jgi:glycosyltransferase involved in cell wall biosynthesis
MSRPVIAVSIHQALGISGVTVAGARLASLKDLSAQVVPLVVGQDVTDQQVGESSLGPVDDVCIASWPAGADPVQQVLTIREAIRTLDASVVCPHDCITGYIAAASLAHRGVRTFFWHHSSGPDGDDIVTAAGGLADVFAAVSPQMAEHARDLSPLLPTPAVGAAPVCVHVPDEPLERVPGIRTLRIMYAGRLERQHKRIMDLVDLANRLHASGTRFRLTIVGDGPARGDLAQALSEHIRAGRAQMVGTLTPAQTAAMYGAHDVGVLVSRSEGMPLAVSECMAAGRPIAITQGCGGAVAAITHGENGWVVPVGDMAMLAKELSKAADSRDRLVRMGRAAHQTARRLWSDSSLTPVYDRLLHAACASPNRCEHASGVMETWNRMMHAFGTLRSITGRGPSAEHLAAFRDLWVAELTQTGLAIDSSSLSCVLPEVPSSAAQRFLNAIAALRAAGRRRIVIYGAGSHTRTLAGIIERTREVIGIVDDAAGQISDTVAGFTVLAPKAAITLEPDAIIVSSSEYEDELMERAGAWAQDVTVAGLYAIEEHSGRLAA